MKMSLFRPALTGLVLTSALAALPVAVRAESTPEATAPAKSAKNLAGKVEAKSETSLTVDGHTVALNAATTYSRNGAAIGNADVKVGDKVNIVTSDDGQVAVSVDVTPGES